MTKEEALAFVDHFIKSGEKFISIRIRDGYIGKITKGKGIQLERGKPKGTFVAVKSGDGKVSIGTSYISPKDKDVPIIGTSLALQDALQDDSQPSTPVKAEDSSLYKFFKIRALCYFYPKKYSHSRGSEKIEYPNYEEIHKNRELALKIKEQLNG